MRGDLGVKGRYDPETLCTCVKLSKNELKDD